MNTPSPLRLVMVPMICSLTLLMVDPAAAAPSQKTPPAPVTPVPAAVESPPPAKRGFLKKINPFRSKETPPAPTPAPAPVSPTVKNSKKSAGPAGPGPTTAVAAAIPPPTPSAITANTAGIPPKPPVKSLATAKTLPPTVAAPAPAAEPAKKAGFFSRLKAKLDRSHEPAVTFQKPERPADWKDRWVVTEESTAFYEFGPSQASGPDLRLPRGQVVKLASASRGWARVELDGGRRGYLGTDQIRQAAETDFAPLAVSPNSQWAAAGGRAPQGWSPIAPPPDLPDLPVPAGMEDSLLLLPPLEFEGTELKKSSLRVPRSSPPDLKPGDALPATSPEVPALKLEESPASPPDQSAPAASPPAAPATEDAKPAPADPAPVTPVAPVTPAVPQKPAEPSSGPTPSV